MVRGVMESSIQEGEGDEVEEDRTRKKSSYDPVSRIAEIFPFCVPSTVFYKRTVL